MAGEDQNQDGGNGNGADGSGGDGPQDAKTRRILTDISSRVWEHPADRAALAALRKLPVFDEILKKLFGFFGEKPVRLAFQASSVRVSKKQFPKLYAQYEEVLRTLDSPEEYPLYVSQTPMVNAGAYGMESPFIILNSGTLTLLDDDEVSFILGHELGHILSDHVLYRTMTVILIQLANLGFPIVGLAARAILMALLEWSRKAELSSDRAGLLSVQDPEVALRTMMKMAGGGHSEELDLGEFITQAEEYRESGDVADQVFKVLNLLGMTHPFFVLRVSELRAWIEAGEYDRIIRGEYTRRGDPDASYMDDVSAAAGAYADGARDLFSNVMKAARGVADDMKDSFKK